jgi:hypothetical protein
MVGFNFWQPVPACCVSQTRSKSVSTPITWNSGLKLFPLYCDTFGHHSAASIVWTHFQTSTQIDGKANMTFDLVTNTGEARTMKVSLIHLRISSHRSFSAPFTYQSVICLPELHVEDNLEGHMFIMFSPLVLHLSFFCRCSNLEREAQLS